MEPIKRVPLVHQVEERIKDLIKEEKLQPGTKLPTEKELGTNLNVSRGTVREAFRFLQAKGIVELKTGKGAFVAEKKAEKPSPAINWLVANETDLRNVFELRYAIEPIAAKRLWPLRRPTAYIVIERTSITIPIYVLALRIKPAPNIERTSISKPIPTAASW